MTNSPSACLLKATYVNKHMHLMALDWHGLITIQQVAQHMPAWGVNQQIGGQGCVQTLGIQPLEMNGSDPGAQYTMHAHACSVCADYGRTVSAKAWCAWLTYQGMIVCMGRHLLDNGWEKHEQQE